jgi:hypothetical protein
MTDELKDILEKFKNNNPHVEIREEDGTKILKPWGDDGLLIECEDKFLDELKILEDVVLNPRYDAIFHKSKNLVEFIYSYLDPSDETSKLYSDRKFKIYFEGTGFRCFFGEPTETLYSIAKFIKRLPSDNNIAAIQILQFRDAQKKETLPKFAKHYFTRRTVPRNFFVELGEINWDNIYFEKLFKHINFAMHYYDRQTPWIAIRGNDSEIESANSTKRCIEPSFPDCISIGQIDEIVLKLIQVATNNDHRMAFLYLYQVFEYAGYYYTDEKTKKELRRILKDPSAINCDESKISELFNIFTDSHHNDEKKMRKVIEECCNSSVIWHEIEHDRHFFSESFSFDGGFMLDPLISNDLTPDGWKNMWMPKLYDQLTKIRNALVHIREKRENRIILPTNKNNTIIKRYIPVIQRCAEQIAINMSK